MASLKLVNTDGFEHGEVEASDRIFGVEANETLVHDVVVALRNAQRQGTHKTKERAEVSGGGAKPFRQKGTGRARQGTIREPQMRGGGTVFGPRPRSYRQNVTTKMRRQALCCALSERVRGERLCVLTDLKVETPKTKPFAQMIDRVAPEGRKTLLVIPGADANLDLSARNMTMLTVRTAADLNAYDVLDAVRVIVQQEALTQLEERLS
jgi:large subunit ribosomal protein L4